MSVAIGAPSSRASASAAGCVYPQPADQRPYGYTPCAPFIKGHAHVLSTFAAQKFGRGATAIVARGHRAIVAGDGLYLVDSPSRVDILWPPRDQDFWYALSPMHEGAMALYRNEQVVGVREDGSLAFHFSIPGTDRGQFDNLTVLEDRRGAIWALASVNYAGALYLANKSAARAEVVNVGGDISKVFLDPNDDAYATLANGTVLRLSASPDARTRIFHKPIALENGLPGQFGADGTWRVQGVGLRGSIWLSNMTTVAHVGSDGRITYLRLAAPYTQMLMLIGSISLRIAPDGSAWAYAHQGFVRITDADVIQTVTVPGLPPQGPTGAFPYAFAPDGSVWYVPNDWGVVHVCIEGHVGCAESSTSAVGR